ncbi:hypothetical protein LSH36_23g10003 [Paralvinella palmiformis]|uniref:C2H2-type domain-containing protein n=1 Tax=Paralvinella palmiformis TaxID=53620 RepID=A0AAD9NGM0_9ANNE|nr:hypothetical protein LSH36_23g10003 [Paralvinella palmiformis]
MSTSSTPSKAKDKERIIKLLHESILHLCKVSVSGPGNIEVDGIVCITQPNESDIVVKVHETFSNVHTDKDGDGRSPSEKRKHSSDGDSAYKSSRKDGSERQRTPVSRRLLSDGETLDLTKDDADAGVSRLHRSPHRNKKADVIDLTSGAATPAPQLNITQVRSLQQQRFGQTARYQRFVSVRGRGGYQMVPRQRFMVQGQMMPGMRHMGQGAVRPISGPIPHRGYRPQGGTIITPRAPIPGSTSTITTTMAGTMLATNGSRMPFDQMQNYKGLHCKYKDCSFACSNKYYLETHVLQHFESDPFCCNEEGCEFKSKNKQNLYQHYKSTHDAGNPQFCFKCMKAFKSPEEMAAHTQTCTVESLKCDHCGEMVMGKVAMAKHLTEVYIAESSKIVEPAIAEQSQSQMSSSGTSQSPATTPSPGQTSMQSPTASSPPQRPPESPRHLTQTVPDMSSPLNIIPDNSVSISQPASQTASLVQPELEQLQQLAGTPSAQTQSTETTVSSPLQMPSLDYNPPTCNTVEYINQDQQQQPSQPMQPMNEPAMNPSLNMESAVQYQHQDRHYSNLELLSQPISMDQPQLDPIQMPSLGDTMSLPEPNQMDTKPPDFNT